MPEPPLEVTAAELDAIIDRALERQKSGSKPEPWDAKTERRTAERRKVAERKIRKIGGILSYKE